jgi:hypothetical protein
MCVADLKAFFLSQTSPSASDDVFGAFVFLALAAQLAMALWFSRRKTRAE